MMSQVRNLEGAHGVPAPAAANPLRVCYLVNQYPKVSHSFIRREVQEVERCGIEVERVSIRGWDLELVDEKDRRERSLTTYILGKGLWPVVDASVREAINSPRRFLKALKLSLATGWRSDRPLAVHLVYLAEAAFLSRFMKSRKLVHVHSHFGTNTTDVAMLASLLSGVGYSFTVHGADEVDKPQALSLSEKVARSRFTIAVSHYGRGQLLRWCHHRQWSKIQVVHCGVDDEFLAAQPIQPDEDLPKLVCVGRLCREKGQLLLVEAAAELVAEGRRFKLVLAGDGELRDQVETLIRQYGLEDTVEITGWVDSGRVRSLIERSRALVLPSLMEGIPVAIMEALALGRPVITTYVGGIPELVRHEGEGWVVPAGAVAELADAMRACLDSDRSVLERMGASGRDRVARGHHCGVEAGRIAELIRIAVSEAK